MRFSSQKGVVWLVVGVQLAAACFVERSQSAVGHGKEQLSVASASEHASDSVRDKLIGVWRDEYQGHRTLTIRSDGTATMVVELCGLHRLFAKTLTFEEEWSVDGDQLHFLMTGGEPAAKVEFVMELKGNRSTQTILKLTESQLVVFDAGEKVEMDWRRERSESVQSTELAQR